MTDPCPRDDDGAWPIRHWIGDTPVPDLDRIPLDRWHEVLVDAGRRACRAAVQHQQTVDLATRATYELEALTEIHAREERRRAEQARARQTAAFPAPLPGGPTPLPARLAARRPAPRQVNFRLDPERHHDLVRAAELLGLRPTAAARLLTVRGGPAGAARGRP